MGEYTGIICESRCVVSCKIQGCARWVDTQALSVSPGMWCPVRFRAELGG